MLDRKAGTVVVRFAWFCSMHFHSLASITYCILATSTHKYCQESIDIYVFTVKSKFTSVIYQFLYQFSEDSNTQQSTRLKWADVCIITSRCISHSNSGPNNTWLHFWVLHLLGLLPQDRTEGINYISVRDTYVRKFSIYSKWLYCYIWQKKAPLFEGALKEFE